MLPSRETIEQGSINTFIYPTSVRGKFHNARVVVRTLLVFLIVLLPWIKIRGHQALLLDIVHRKFSFFGTLFFAQDVPLLFLLIINFVLGVALITALFGRVWCGWMCPQTVFIEGLFRRIEEWTEGRAEQRRKSDSLPLNAERLIRKTAKWFLFLVCTLIVSHSILAIFIGSDHLLSLIRGPFSENPTALIFVLLSNCIFLADFGWLREQFCMVACPYGKFQSVLQDEQTVSVMYDAKRGEPRRGVLIEGAVAGDCVNCFRCVRVCPTGIDIRDGSQLECIACTACVDACDDVMTRLKKPTSLIGYHSETKLAGQKQKWFRPRIAIYASLITLFGGVAIFQLITLKPFEVMIYKTKGDPFRVVRSEPAVDQITNLFNGELSNKSGDPISIRFAISDESKLKLVMPNNPIVLEEGKVQSNPFTVEFDKSILTLGSADSRIQITVKNLVTGQEWKDDQRIHVIGPF